VFPLLVVTALLQPLSGDLSARFVARHQPVKLAALEGQFATERSAPLRIGGIPDERAEVTRGAIELPGMLSWLAFGDANAEVRGLHDVPRADRPPVLLTHVAFQLMVASGMALLAVGLVGAGMALRRDPRHSRAFLRLVVAVSPLGLLGLEAGWMVTELGRQPWIVYGVMRTRDAVTPMPGMAVPLALVAALYALLGIVVLRLLRRQVFATGRDDVH